MLVIERIKFNTTRDVLSPGKEAEDAVVLQPGFALENKTCTARTAASWLLSAIAISAWGP